MELNASQQRVVDFGAGAALVIAGAGTGKTRVLVHRTVRLLTQGVPPDRILLITFTRRAAQELRDRVTSLCPQAPSLPWCGTFHAVGARLVRLFAHTAGLPPEFTVLDASDAGDLFRAILTERYCKDARKYLPQKGTLVAIHSYQTNTRLPLEEVLQRRYPTYLGKQEELQQLFEAYRERKRAGRLFDYDDLLTHWIALLQQGGPSVRGLFDWVMVDEYQDTNALQAEILALLARDTPNVLVVGDDAQAIYGFRGATVRNILDFQQHFPSCESLYLERNYRSTQEILDVSNALQAEAREGYRKELVSHRGPGIAPVLARVASEWQEADLLVQEILDGLNQGTPLTEQAVLVRSATHSFGLETLLQRSALPYRKIGGLRFADTAHIKDVLAILRCARNRWDETAWRRFLGLLPGIGDRTADRLFRATLEADDPAATFAKQKLPKRAESLKHDLHSLVAFLFAAHKISLPTLIDRACTFYRPLLNANYDNADMREHEIQLLQEIATRYDKLEDFLDDLAVGDSSIRGNENADGLTISTIHSAKGCEWDIVYVMHVIEGGIPIFTAATDAATLADHVEEERRLLYVAMTRARNRLVLTCPAARRNKTRQQSEPCSPSRFLTPRVAACLGGPHAPRAAPTTHRPSIPRPPRPPQTTPFDDEPYYDYQDC